MSRRKSSYGKKYRPGTLLEGLPAGQMGILEFTALLKAKRDAITAGDTGKRCCCPPAQVNRVGGCQPGLTWADDDHTALTAICRTCMKPLVSSQHRRRDQVHMIGLTKLPLDHIDMEDRQAWGVFVDSTPIDPGQREAQLQQFELERVGGLP